MGNIKFLPALHVEDEFPIDLRDAPFSGVPLDMALESWERTFFYLLRGAELCLQAREETIGLTTEG